MGSGTFWLALVLICYIILSKDLYTAALHRTFSPESYHILQEVSGCGKLLYSAENSDDSLLIEGMMGFIFLMYFVRDTV